MYGCDRGKSYLGAEGLVPRCGRGRSSVSEASFLGASHTPPRRREKRGTLSTENHPNIHSLTERDAQSADCHLFSTLKNCAIIIGGGVKVRANIKKCVSAATFPICRASDIAE